MLVGLARHSTNGGDRIEALILADVDGELVGDASAALTAELARIEDPIDLLLRRDGHTAARDGSFTFGVAERLMPTARVRS